MVAARLVGSCGPVPGPFRLLSAAVSAPSGPPRRAGRRRPGRVRRQPFHGRGGWVDAEVTKGRAGPQVSDFGCVVSQYAPPARSQYAGVSVEEGPSPSAVPL